jgi:hypothetical protein
MSSVRPWLLPRSGSADSIGRRGRRTRPPATRSKASVSISPWAASPATAGSGQGGAMNGPVPALAKTAMPFDGFKGQLRQPADEMPAYSEKVMTDKQIADIYAFVESLPGRRPTKDMKIFDN